MFILRAGLVTEKSPYLRNEIKSDIWKQGSTIRVAFPRENSDDERKMFAVSDIEILVRQPISQIAVYTFVRRKRTWHHGQGRAAAQDENIGGNIFLFFFFFSQNAPLPLRATQPFLLFTLFCLVAKENVANRYRQRVILLKHTIIHIILYMQQSYSQNIQVKKGVWLNWPTTEYLDLDLSTCTLRYCVTVVSSATSQKEGHGFNFRPGAFSYGVSMSAWVLCGYSSFLTQSEDMLISLSGNCRCESEWLSVALW